MLYDELANVFRVAVTIFSSRKIALLFLAVMQLVNELLDNVRDLYKVCKWYVTSLVEQGISFLNDYL